MYPNNISDFCDYSLFPLFGTVLVLWYQGANRAQVNTVSWGPFNPSNLWEHDSTQLLELQPWGSNCQGFSQHYFCDLVGRLIFPQFSLHLRVGTFCYNRADLNKHFIEIYLIRPYFRRKKLLHISSMRKKCPFVFKRIVFLSKKFKNNSQTWGVGEEMPLICQKMPFP